MKKTRGLLIFDLDGVLLSESCYWDVAALTIATFAKRLCPNRVDQHIPVNAVRTANDIAAIREIYLPADLLQKLRSYALNSNWDKSYACVMLLGLMAGDEVRGSVAQVMTTELSKRGLTGQALIQQMQSEERTVLEALQSDTEFGPLLGKGLFDAVKNCFQSFYLGSNRLSNPLFASGGGLVQFESCLLDPQAVLATFLELQNAGWQLGIGTGRPRVEAMGPLHRMGLWDLFSAEHICTIDEVALQEHIGGVPKNSLSKPHPFTFQKAAENKEGIVVVIGDSVADLLAAKQADYTFVGIGDAASFGDEGSYATACVESVLSLPVVLASL